MTEEAAPHHSWTGARARRSRPLPRPVTEKPWYFGGVPSFDTLRRICREAVTAGVTPGLVVLIGRGGRDVFSEAFGQRQVEPFPVAASPETVYDLASLTKALVTSLLAMQAVASGRLDLEEPAPGTAGAAGATVRHLLAHAAGLPAHRPFYLQQ